MKKYKHGLIIGKFYPFHFGHKYLIDSAIEQCEELTVLVCSIKKQKIPGELRYEWIKQTYKPLPNVHIVHVSDEVAQYPHSDNDELFWDIWIGIIMREIKKIDVVFTSEDYGKDLAKRINHKYPNMNIDNIVVDIVRERYPISGTEIRKNPIGNWKYIPAVVKPYFMKKIILVGPESTGKSILSEQLANHFGIKHIPEYGREYTDNCQLSYVEEMTNIAYSHVKQSQEISLYNAQYSPKNILSISDTDVITTQIWSEIYFKSVPDSVMALQDDYTQKGDLYLLMAIDIPWEDDGTREFPHLREWHFNRIRKELQDRNLPFKMVSGTGIDRFDCAMNIINREIIIPMSNKINNN